MKEERFKLGVIFNFSSSWMGGIIYIINLVKTLNFLDDKEKPYIWLFYNPTLTRFLDEFEYPYLEKVEWSFPPLIKGNIISSLIRKNLFIEDILKKYCLNAVYPLQDYPVKTKTNVKLISWSADFQHKHYPEFFSKKQIFGRNLRVKNALKHTDALVLSSYDAHEDLKRFFKVRVNLNIHIYHFVSIIEEMEETEIGQLREKYKLPDKYYMISNQFHKHKNHRVAFQAVARLKDMGFRVNLAITGKFPDASDSPYMKELHRILDEHNIHDQVVMLGVISRKEQLQIMRHSQAVIQPSLFEGWSTVIEDARSLQVPVIASNLNVNIEQMGDSGVYFNPDNAEELAGILKDFPERNLNDILYENYETRVRKAAKELMRIFRE